jgi:hypothetical protein
MFSVTFSSANDHQPIIISIQMQIIVLKTGPTDKCDFNEDDNDISSAKQISSNKEMKDHFFDN